MSFHKACFVLRSLVLNLTFYDLLYPELILYFIISRLTYNVSVTQTSGQPCECPGLTSGTFKYGNKCNA